MESLSVFPCETVNIIYGDNAQGKTNLLEAVWLLSGAKSFRGAKDADFVRFGESRAVIESEFFCDGRQQAAVRNGGSEYQPAQQDLLYGSAVRQCIGLKRLGYPSL